MMDDGVQGPHQEGPLDLERLKTVFAESVAAAQANLSAFVGQQPEQLAEEPTPIAEYRPYPGEEKDSVLVYEGSFAISGNYIEVRSNERLEYVRTLLRLLVSNAGERLTTKQLIVLGFGRGLPGWAQPQRMQIAFQRIRNLQGGQLDETTPVQRGKLGISTFSWYGVGVAVDTEVIAAVETTKPRTSLLPKELAPKPSQFVETAPSVLPPEPASEAPTSQPVAEYVQTRIAGYEQVLSLPLNPIARELVSYFADQGGTSFGLLDVSHNAANVFLSIPKVKSVLREINAQAKQAGVSITFSVQKVKDEDRIVTTLQ